MTELKKQIIDLTISNKTAGFFRDKEFQWHLIPEFAVITGINGSGKTKLLDHINELIDAEKLPQTNTIITYKANSDSKYSVEARQHLGPKKWFFVEKNQKKNHEL
ncbi:MAG: hypothetical protein LW599_05500 [Rickettsiaceae bacterium]|nr:hypothetical protein [Rickettsiaceae bacterium]